MLKQKWLSVIDKKFPPLIVVRTEFINATMTATKSPLKFGTFTHGSRHRIKVVNRCFAIAALLMLSYLQFGLLFVFDKSKFKITNVSTKKKINLAKSSNTTISKVKGNETKITVNGTIGFVNRTEIDLLNQTFSSAFGNESRSNDYHVAHPLVHHHKR